MLQKRNLLTMEALAEVAAVRQPPCLSLYQPTHRHDPENKQDPIRFCNLVKELPAMDRPNIRGSEYFDNNESPRGLEIIEPS